MKLLNVSFWVAALVTCCVGCSKNNDTPENINPTPKEQWGATLKGNGETLAAYPDLYSNYWEYTYNVNEYPDVALRIKGSFPNARFFSFTVYDDERGDAIDGIDDYNIIPDDGSDNPFVITSSKNNTFTIYVVPASMDDAQLAQLPSNNICKLNSRVKRAAVCIRQYLGVDEYGGVELPAIEAINIHSLEDVQTPPRTESQISSFPSNYVYQPTDMNRDMPFFRASKGSFFPNYSTDYLYARTILSQDSVLIFRFIPVSVPTKVEENVGAHARYWSICLGSAFNTRSYYSVYDKAANVPDEEYCSFLICLKQNPYLSNIHAKVDELTEKGENWQLIEWDSEKIDLDGKAIGNTIVTMYRQILPDSSWEHSISRMEVTPYGDPVNNVENPETQLAHKALGAYGPYGFKYATNYFLSEDFKQEDYLE